MLYKIHVNNPITVIESDQNVDQPKSFKQNTKDFFYSDEDNLLGNIFE